MSETYRALEPQPVRERLWLYTRLSGLAAVSSVSAVGLWQLGRPIDRLLEWPIIEPLEWDASHATLQMMLEFVHGSLQLFTHVGFPLVGFILTAILALIAVVSAAFLVIELSTELARWP